jgi:hypothetical protein
VNRKVPSNGALGRNIGVSYKLGRSSFVITGRIPRSAGLPAVSYRDLGESLAPQALWVLRGLDKVARGLPRLPGLWIRSPGPLAGWWGF